jgi:hypothetical protein
LEHWIDAKISQDGMTDEKIIEMIKESYQRSLNANIQHHAKLAKLLQDSGEITLAKKHKLLASAYQALLK